MPLEFGLALYRSKKGIGSHRVHIFDKKPYQAQRSTSDVNAIDAHIHGGSPRKVMIALRDIFKPTGSTTSVPEMLVSYRALQARLPVLRHAAGGGSLYGAAMFKALVLFASVEVVHRRKPD